MLHIKVHLYLEFINWKECFQHNQFILCYFPYFLCTISYSAYEPLLNIAKLLKNAAEKATLLFDIIDPFVITGLLLLFSFSYTTHFLKIKQTKNKQWHNIKLL